MVRDGVLITPSVSDDILEGITRAGIIEIAGYLGIPVKERQIDRSELYIADEVFLCGTGAQVSPVASVDHRPVGDGASARSQADQQDLLRRRARPPAGVPALGDTRLQE
jgi:branched-chain amino acid aminotransferase